MSTTPPPPPPPNRPSSPIPIATRRRSASESSGYSDESPSPQTPFINTNNPAIASPSTSPILSYFFASKTSPTANRVFPFSDKNNSAVADVDADDESQDAVPPVAMHARRMSATWASQGKFGPQPQNGATTDIQHERGAGLFRRLSLGSGAFKPGFGGRTSPPSFQSTSNVPTVSNNMTDDSNRRSRVHRANTLAVPSSRERKRAPSPMGERILKGHFDGFN